MDFVQLALSGFRQFVGATLLIATASLWGYVLLTGPAAFVRAFHGPAK